MKTNNLLLRILTFATGIFFMALGVSLAVKADLGVSPISCIPYIYSLKFSWTLGQLTVVFNIILIALQMAILRRNYQLMQLAQLPVVFIFGFFIDLTLGWLSGIKLPGYAWQAFVCLLSCAVIGFGVFLEVKARITYLPGEGFVIAIVQAFRKEFGKVKIAVDSSMVIVGTLSSFLLLLRLEGVREGTIASALLVGYLARFYSNKFLIADKWLGN